MDSVQSVRPKTSPRPKPPLAYSGKYKSVDEYAEALRCWMLNVHRFQCVSAAFPMFLASMQEIHSLSANRGADGAGVANNTQSTTGSRPPVGQNDARDNRVIGAEFILPSIWKRILAEVIDFLLLFFMKIFFTYLAMDFFDLSLLDEVNKYDFESFGSDLMSDYQLALSMTSEILLLDLVHRLGTCLFEAICLCRSAAGTGGATPGKKIMGLRVIKCDQAAFGPAGHPSVIVSPAEDLGFSRALLRSFLKNLAITFLFPVGLTLFSFRHCRTIYDVLSGSIVVENNDP